MKLNKVEIMLSGKRCCPTVTVHVDDQPVEIAASVNGKPIDEQQLLNIVHYAGMVHAANTVNDMPDGESADAFLQGMLEG